MILGNRIELCQEVTPGEVYLLGQVPNRALEAFEQHPSLHAIFHNLGAIFKAEFLGSPGQDCESSVSENGPWAKENIEISARR